jgi:two-component system OmpR family response regulator
MTKPEPHILIVDDEIDIREPLAKYLRSRGFRCSLAADAQQAEKLLGSSSADLIVLDVMMQGEDGLSFGRRIREQLKIPIIFLSALTEDTDRIVGLEIGADDYVSKPFNPRELVARIKAVLHRSEMLPRNSKRADGVAQFGGWRFDLLHPEIIGDDGQEVSLSSGEHALLVAFVKHAGLILSRDQLLDLTKGRDSRAFDRSIDNQVSRLRKKVESDPQNPKVILTERSGGYVFAARLEWDTE